jgi:hypothetical protein
MTALPLDRTVRLLHSDLFPSLPLQVIAEELASTRVLLRADARSLGSPAAETALVTTFVALAQSGAEIWLDLPPLESQLRQPPLRDRQLLDGLLDLSRDLIVPAHAGSATVEAVVLVGETPAPDARAPVLRLGAGSFSARVGIGSGSEVGEIRSELPFGSILAGAAAAAEVMRIACGRIASSHDVDVPAEFDLGGPRSVEIDLPPLQLPPRLHLGAVDVVSAGAIANACLFALLRVPGLRGSLRIFDRDRGEETNLNRYPLLRRSLLGLPKVDVLAALATEQLEIEGVPLRLSEQTLPEVLPLRERVLIGVDDIPSRWVVQRHAPSWLCVAGTSHFTALVSEHTRSTPCAGCLHPYDDELAPAELPTISFVSLLAGLLQAYRLLAAASGAEPSSPTLVAGFNLAASRSVSQVGFSPSPCCPVSCGPSRA